MSRSLWSGVFVADAAVQGVQPGAGKVLTIAMIRAESIILSRFNIAKPHIS
jgi:hypothetical protein